MSDQPEAPSKLLAYRRTGAGLPVVFLHPTPLDHDYWRPLIAELGGVSALALDLRGHGESELGGGLPVGEFDLTPDAPVLSMGRLAADVLHLLDTLNVPEAVFVGCSIGGYVLLEIWRRAPQRVRGLAFVCSKPQADGPAARAKRAETIAKVRAEGVERLFDGMVENLTGASSRAEHPSLAAEARARMTLTPEAVIAVQAGLATRPDSIATVATIEVPVLAIAGGQDTAVSVADMDAFRQAPGGCESHLVAAAGHFAAFERPQRVHAFMAPWLEQFKR